MSGNVRQPATSRKASRASTDLTLGGPARWLLTARRRAVHPFHLLGVWLRCQSYYAKLFSALFRMPQIVLGLLIDPAFCSGIKGNRKTNSHLRTDAGPTVQYSGKCLSAHPQSLCRLGHGETKRSKTKVLDDSSRVWRIVHSHCGQALLERLVILFSHLPNQPSGLQMKSLELRWGFALELTRTAAEATRSDGSNHEDSRLHLL